MLPWIHFPPRFNLRGALLKTTGQDLGLCAGSADPTSPPALASAGTFPVTPLLWRGRLPCVARSNFTQSSPDPPALPLRPTLPTASARGSPAMAEALFPGNGSGKLGAFPLRCRLINAELSGKMPRTAKDTYCSGIGCL